MPLIGNVIAAVKEFLKTRTFQINITKRFEWTGYTEPMENPQYAVPTRNNIKLIDAICVAYDNEHYAPVIKDGKLETSYCNLACNEVAQKMGCNDLFNPIERTPKTADEIADFMAANPNDWQELRCAGLKPPEQEIAFRAIQAWANIGYLLFAVLKSTELGTSHGHIAVIRPGELKSSGKWGLVPSVMNIGKECFIGRSKQVSMRGLPVGVNEAFIPVPHFYVWK